MDKVFPLLIDPFQTVGAVGAEMQPCLEVEAAPAGPRDSWAQLWSSYLGAYQRWASCTDPAQIYHHLPG